MEKSKQARCSGSGEDRLSSLPDDILINNILSLLPMIEAQRASVLARQWRHLWLYGPCLDLDGSPKVRAGLEEVASKYAEWVDRTVAAYRGGTPLRNFRVLFHLGHANSGSIDSWLSFALRQGVEVLELDCCRTDICGFLWYMPGLKVDHTMFPNIRLLKSLTLKCVNVPHSDDRQLERLLSSCCETLETLHLDRVTGLTRVTVPGPAVSRLKHIRIDSCDGLQSVAIHAPTPDLVSFTFPAGNQAIAVHIEHAPQLVDLRLRVFHCTTVSPLLRYLPQLEALHLVYFTDEDIDPSNEFPPVLSRLKHLTVDFFEPAESDEFIGKKLSCLEYLMKIAPSLQHITLEVGELWPGKLWMEIADMRLDLQAPVIEIAGLDWSQKVDRRLALHLIRASPKLEKLIINRKDPSLRGLMLGPYKHYKKTVKSWVNIIEEVIGPKLPPKAKLVII